MDGINGRDTHSSTAMPEGWGGSDVIDIKRVKTLAPALACRRKSEICDFVPVGILSSRPRRRPKAEPSGYGTYRKTEFSRAKGRRRSWRGRGFERSISGHAGCGQVSAPAPAARSTLAPEAVQRTLRGARDRHPYYLRFPMPGRALATRTHQGRRRGFPLVKKKCGLLGDLYGVNHITHQ